jgi:hypothetical protein
MAGINVTYESSKNECLCGCIDGGKESKERGREIDLLMRVKHRAYTRNNHHAQGHLQGMIE